MNLRALARNTKTHLLSFQKAHRPIIIMATRRGGSTMLADAVAANRGVWFANEPFAILPTHQAYEFKRAQLQEVLHSHYFALEGPIAQQFEAYANGLLDARFRELGNCRKTKPPLRADRVCLKVLNALWMIDWFCVHSDSHVLPLLRHPAAQALSVLRQGWGFPVEAYYAEREKLAGQFNDIQQSLMEDVLRSEDPWRIAMLDYVVTTKVMREKHGAALFRYEDIVRAPVAFVDEVLIARYGLTDRDAMIAALGKPSGSSRMSTSTTNSAITKGDTETILKGWMTKLDKSQVQSGQQILDAFEVSQYNLQEAY